MASWMVRKSVSAALQLINLVELKLLQCYELRSLPTLGQYPKLRFLEIRGLCNVKCIGNEFYINKNSGDKIKPIALFPALEKFTLWRMKEVKEWLDVEPTVAMFPSLKELRAVHCDKLRSVPLMSRFSSLEMLTIRDCKELRLMGDGVFPSTLKNV
ncbi:hypothetical protein DITRI_Ditri15bG0015500 [Diplodiscus trichospermus]